MDGIQSPGFFLLSPHSESDFDSFPRVQLNTDTLPKPENRKKIASLSFTNLVQKLISILAHKSRRISPLGLCRTG
jgi:hypothetical protein